MWLWITLGVIAFLVVVVALLVGLTAPLVMRQVKQSYTVEAASNARQISLALQNFDLDYGSFPDGATAAEVTKETGSLIPVRGESSNAYFRQLLAAGQGSEKMFYNKAAGRKPDYNAEGTSALEKGECGFSYVVGLNASSNGSAPLVVAPLVPGTTTFDPKPFNGKAIVLRVDGSVIIESISKSGEVLDQEGKNILDPTQSYWGGNPVIIANPE